MKLITIALAVLVIATAAWWIVDTRPIFLFTADTEPVLRSTVDLWGPGLRDARYKITKIEPALSGFSVYGHRIGKIPWLDDCIIRPSVNGEGFTLRYEDEGQSHYIWTSHAPTGD